MCVSCIRRWYSTITINIVAWLNLLLLLTPVSLLFLLLSTLVLPLSTIVLLLSLSSVPLVLSPIFSLPAFFLLLLFQCWFLPASTACFPAVAFSFTCSSFFFTLYLFFSFQRLCWFLCCPCSCFFASWKSCNVAVVVVALLFVTLPHNWVILVF